MKSSTKRQCERALGRPPRVKALRHALGALAVLLAHPPLVLAEVELAARRRGVEEPDAVRGVVQAPLELAELELLLADVAAELRKTVRSRVRPSVKCTSSYWGGRGWRQVRMRTRTPVGERPAEQRGSCRWLKRRGSDQRGRDAHPRPARHRPLPRPGHPGGWPIPSASCADAHATRATRATGSGAILYEAAGSRP